MNLEDIVEVIFLDHSQDLGEPIVCAVYGIIEHIDKTFINVTAWHPVSIPDDDGENSTTYTIIRACIQQLRILQ